PFIDSSYKPIFFWQRQEVARIRALDVAIDGEIGLQHESNGKSGDDSRSLNVAFIKPSLRFRPDEDLSFTVAPRFNIPISDPEEGNSDIERYRGYVDYGLTVESTNGLQVAFLGRLGTSGKGSLQVDVTYPLNRLWRHLPDVYFQLQYFNGYGETLL